MWTARQVPNKFNNDSEKIGKAEKYLKCESLKLCMYAYVMKNIYSVCVITSTQLIKEEKENNAYSLLQVS